MPDPAMTPEEFLRQVAQIAVMSPDHPEWIVAALRRYREKDDRFQEWAQSYLDSGRWAGHDRGDAIKQTLLARDEEVKRLRAALEKIAKWNQSEAFTSLPASVMRALAKDALADEEVSHG